MSPFFSSGYVLSCCGPPFLQAGQLLLPVFLELGYFACKFRTSPMNTVEGFMGPSYDHKVVCG
jgi:hypothetical protein